MESMEAIYQKHSQLVYKYLITLTRNGDLAEELTQETFYQAIKSVDKFDQQSKVSTWLCGIAKNCFYTHLRKNKGQENLDILDYAGPQGPSIEDQYISKAGHIDLLKKIQKLPPTYKEIMYLRLFGNLSFREIGDILSQTENWARVNFYRAKMKLREELENE